MHRLKAPKQSLQSYQAGKSKIPDSEVYDYMIKIIIVGNSGVGKTNIISRYCGAEGDDTVFKDYHVNTIGVDFNIKFLNLDGRKIKMQIWDTAGQQRFKTITETYYKGAAGIILAYSVQSEQSFHSICKNEVQLEKWIEQVNLKSSENVLKVIVANKIDIEQTEGDQQFCMEQARKITTARGVALANKYNIDYYQTSAKNNEGVYEMFEDLAIQIKNKIQELKLVKNEVQQGSFTLSLNSHFIKNNKKVVKEGIEYKVQSSRPLITESKSKCRC